MQEISLQDFNAVTKDGFVIVDFFGDGCGNCKMAEPILNQLESEHKNIKFIKMNTRGAQDLVEKYGITSLPTLIFLNKGESVDKLVGLKPKTLINRKIHESFGLE